MPNPRGKPGDLYAEARLMVPKSPTTEEERLWKELADTSMFNPRSAR
jgi:curved DNA-binding protein